MKKKSTKKNKRYERAKDVREMGRYDCRRSRSRWGDHTYPKSPLWWWRIRYIYIYISSKSAYESDETPDLSTNESPVESPDFSLLESADRTMDRSDHKSVVETPDLSDHEPDGPGECPSHGPLPINIQIKSNQIKLYLKSAMYIWKKRKLARSYLPDYIL